MGAAMTSSSFQPFEQRIEHVTGNHPDSPRSEIILSRLFFHVFKRFNESQNIHLSAFGLNSTSWLALIMMHATPGNALNPCELSEAMISSRTNITRLADELVEKGWVERSASGEDRRKVVLSLTDAGRDLVESVLPHQWQYYREMWSCFSPGEIATFEALMRKLLDRLDASGSPSCQS